MAQFPFVYNYTSGRAYYGSMLSNQNVSPQYWSREPTKPQTSNKEALKNTVLFAGTVGTIFASGFIPTKTGNIWDKYNYGIRAFEELSPGGIFRTFQLGNLTSPFTSTVRNANQYITPDLLRNNVTYTSYLSSVIGGNNRFRLLQEGVTFRNNKLYWGTGNQVALKYASGLLSEGHGSAQRIGAAYARNFGVKSSVPLEHFFSNITPNIKQPGIVNPALGNQAFQLIGGQSRAQAGYRYLAAIGTEQISRFNRLLNAQTDIPILKKPLEKIGSQWKRIFGKKFALGVEESGGLKMFGKLGIKYGVGLTALTLGYKTLDWSVRQNELFDNTLLDEGLTVGAATIGVKANLGISKLSEKLGLQDYREKQEQLAPGSTSLTKLSAFPIMGALAPIGGLYGYKLSQMTSLLGQGLSPAEARETVEQGIKEWKMPLLSSIKEIFESNKILSPLAKMTPGKAGAIIGATIGAALIAPFIPGALVPSKRPDELEALYTGKKEVAIKKGRWWLAGRSSYEGDKISTFLPHWYSRMRMRATEKGLWGEDEDKISPLSKWWKAETSYELEKRHYKDRPYPISSPAFEDLPLIGPLLGATIGRIIKPPVVMHKEEYQQNGGYKVPSSRYGEKYETSYGEKLPGKPVSPYSPTQVIGKQIYNVTEAIGLTGFLESSIKEKLTGSQDWFDQYSQLESSRRMAGSERNYWDKELGDIAGLSESWRRLYPHKQNQIDLYNPIRNQMPDWLPSAGEKSPDFQTGDPFSKVIYGEYRLPGEGYAARYPELKGVAPEDYSAVHRYRILGDVAPYSDAFKQARINVLRARKLKDWTDRDEFLYQQSFEQIKQKKEGKVFQEYQNLNAMGGFGKLTPAFMSETLAEINETQKAGISPNKSTLSGSYWEMLTHNAETALDNLTPLSPGAKLVRQRSPIESYEREQLYSRKEAFWQHPIEHFIKPFIRSTANALGYEGVPEEIQEKRSLEEYFDVLRYVKATRMSNIASQARDEEAVKQFETQRNQTLFGINPYGMNYRDLLTALPKKERDYFDAFSQAKSVEERERILQMVPDNEKGLYVARWKQQEASQLKQAIKEGGLTEQQKEKASKEISGYYKDVKSEGMPTSKELFGEFSATRAYGESYPDWYRRTKLLPKYNIPGPDYVGFHSQVDLEDIKLKVVQAAGFDFHDFNLWESREKKLVNKPYIDEEVVKETLNPRKLSIDEKKKQIDEVLLVNRVKADTFIRRDKNTEDDKIEVELQQDKTEEIKKAISKAL